MAGSLAYIQLEKQNARLKEALVRYVISVYWRSMTSLLVSLRDVSQETEQEHRRRIADMEKDVMNVDDLSGKHLIASSTHHSSDN
jgi:dynactin 1